MSSVTPDTHIYVSNVIEENLEEFNIYLPLEYRGEARDLVRCSSAALASTLLTLHTIRGMSLFGKSTQGGRWRPPMFAYLCSRPLPPRENLGRTSFKTTADSGKAAPRQSTGPPVSGGLAKLHCGPTEYISYKTKVNHLLDSLLRT
jgi:hypothetical protein